jgi:hypothetical protein
MARRARLASRDPGWYWLMAGQGERIRGDAAGLADRQRCRSRYGWYSGEGRPGLGQAASRRDQGHPAGRGGLLGA